MEIWAIYQPTQGYFVPGLIPGERVKIDEAQLGSPVFTKDKDQSDELLKQPQTPLVDDMPARMQLKNAGINFLEDVPRDKTALMRLEGIGDSLATAVLDYFGNITY